jgi:hypothetical protein
MGCFKLFGCWQNLVQLREEEGLLLKERRSLKNVCSISFTSFETWLCSPASLLCEALIWC